GPAPGGRRDRADGGEDAIDARVEAALAARAPRLVADVAAELLSGFAKVVAGAAARGPSTHAPGDPAHSEHEREEGRSWREKVRPARRSEEHTSELQSRGHLVCRLLLEKKNKRRTTQCLV